MTLEGAFESTVMFFGLTNSLAIFQAMINELLRDLIIIRQKCRHTLGLGLRQR